MKRANLCICPPLITAMNKRKTLIFNTLSTENNYRRLQLKLLVLLNKVSVNKESKNDCALWSLKSQP